jgi:hypothetical protein
VLLAEGRGVAQDDRAAFPLLERGCSDSVPEACRYVAIFHEEGRAGLPRSEVTARYFRTKACENGDMPSCTELAKGFESLCGNGEQTELACMTGQSRLLSLCSRAASGGQPTLAYRFGTRATVDLTFSGDFRLTEDSWTNGERRSLAFTNGPAHYALTETQDNSQDPPSKRVEITVGLDGETTRIPCRYPIIGSLDSDAIRKASIIFVEVTAE